MPLPPDFAALVPELFDRLSGMAVPAEVGLRRLTRADGGHVFVAFCSNGIHESTESAAHALESLCDSFRPRLEDLESTQMRVAKWFPNLGADAAVEEARKLLAALGNAVTNRLGLAELQAHNAFVSAALDEIEAGDEPVATARRVIETALMGSGPSSPLDAKSFVAAARITA